MTHDVMIEQLAESKKRRLGVRGRRTLLRAFALAVMLIYTALTLFPFYALFVRSFVSTRDSADLHLWIPETAEVNLEMQAGNLGVFYNLDMAVGEGIFGIPPDEFIMSRTTFRRLQRLAHPADRDTLSHTVVGYIGAHPDCHRGESLPGDHPLDLHWLWAFWAAATRSDVCV